MDLLRRWLGLPWRASSCYLEIRFVGVCRVKLSHMVSQMFSYLKCQSFKITCYCTLHTCYVLICIFTACTFFTFEITHLLPVFTGKKLRLTFTAELFLRAIFKYQIEVFGEHELIFLVVPKIVTTMTLGMEEFKKKAMSPVWPVSLQVLKLKFWYGLRQLFKVLIRNR